MKKALVIAGVVATAACGSDLSMHCSMNVTVNGGPQQTVSCFAAGAFSPGTGNAVSIAMDGTLAGINVAQFAMTLPSAPTIRTYSTAADVSAAAGQVQTTNATYVQNSGGPIGIFSVVLTSVDSASANGQTAYFIHGSATITLAGQSGAPGTATITATF